MAYNRYIYFASSGKSPGLVDNLSNDLKMINTKNENFAENSKAVAYIQNFLSKIKKMADIQRKNQMRYIQDNFKNSDVKNYINSKGQFNYIQFIKDLNLLRKGVDQFKTVLNTFETRITNINKVLKQMEEDKKQYKYGQVHNISLQRADQLYRMHNMTQYRAMIQAAVSAYNKKHKEANINIGKTISGKIAETIQQVISKLSSNQTIIQAIKNGINSNATIPQLQGAIITAAVAYLKNNNFDSQAVEITDDIAKNLAGIIETSLGKISFENVIQSRSMEDFLKFALQKETGEKLAENFILMDANEINKLQGTNNKMGQLLFEAYTQFIKDRKNDAIKQSTARRNFSMRIKSIVDQEKRDKNITSKINKNNINKIFQRIKGDFICSDNPPKLNLDIDTLVRNAFTIDSMKGSTMAEIVGTIENLIIQKIQNAGNIFNVFLPGDKITLKNDFVFSYHFNDISDNQFIKRNDGIQTKLEEMIDNLEKDFLESYNNDSKGSTDVRAAYDNYFQTIKNIYEQQKKALKNAKTQLQRNQIEKMTNALAVGVSVKEYNFYNNRVGYGAGSLGGGGRVVQAVPNLLNMIALGGITIPDAQAVINALLNSFPESAIGTGYVEDLQNFLLVGAAMMLFDDGFTSGEVFLKQIETQLENFNIPSIHLLLLDGIYIPQSYVLQNIYQNLLNVYQDILIRFDQLASGKITGGATASLSLHNDINSNVLRQMQEKGGDPWVNMSNYAQQNVTISYFFMAGMLDIVSQLNNILG